MMSWQLPLENLPFLQPLPPPILPDSQTKTRDQDTRIKTTRVILKHSCTLYSYYPP